MIDHGTGKRRQAAAFQSFALLNAKLNAIAIKKPASTAGFLPYLVRHYFSIVFRLDQRQPVRVVAHTSNRGDDGALA